MPSTSDAFSTGDLAANWGILDGNPGYHVCTSTTRPTWSSAQTGQQIVETDTLLKWEWTGSAFVRSGSSHGTSLVAHAEKSTFTSTTSTSLVVALATGSGFVRPGNRPLILIAKWSLIENSGYGAVFMSLCQSATNNVGSLFGWTAPGDSTSPSPGSQGGGSAMCYVYPTGLASGSYNWSIQFASFAFVPTPGTSTIHADASTKLTLDVLEL